MKKNLRFFLTKFLENRPSFFAFIRPFEANLFYQYKKFLTPKILDFGCGDGFFASLIFDPKYIDVGLDMQNSRAYEAGKRQIYQELVLYDGNKIPFGNEIFTSVISNSVLEHVPTLEQSLLEINRVMKKGGHFLTTVMTDQWDNNLFGKVILGQRYSQIMKQVQEHHNLLSVKGWQKKFEKSGFKIEKIVGYLNQEAVRHMELNHYISIHALFFYKFFRVWNPIKSWYKLFELEDYFLNFNKAQPINKAAGLFFILKKL